MMEKTIDIEKILAGKMGDKARFVPHFLVSWLKRVVHEDEVNKYLWESRHLSGTDWLEECVRYLRMTLKIEGLENLPDRTTDDFIPSSQTILLVVLMVWP